MKSDTAERPFAPRVAEKLILAGEVFQGGLGLVGPPGTEPSRLPVFETLSDAGKVEAQMDRLGSSESDGLLDSRSILVCKSR